MEENGKAFGTRLAELCRCFCFVSWCLFELIFDFLQHVASLDIAHHDRKNITCTCFAFFSAVMHICVQETVAKLRSEGSRVLVVVDFDCTLLQVGG